jgi:SAM-dependent methyltransferase
MSENSTPYGGTIDWDDYWTDADGDDREDAAPSARHVVDPLLELLDRRGAPDSLADVGCGPAAVPFAVAERFPGADVVGYDAAPAVLDRNRERAAEEGRDVDFERAVLPDFDPGRTFDVVTCTYTLVYVADGERALANLYDAVAPGGVLVVTYHNRMAAAHFRRVAADPHEHLPEDGPFDPDRYAERFELLLEERSTLSYDAVHDALGTWPRSVFSAVDAEPYPAHRHNPLVYVPRPD